eukprot:scaffold323_cov363-Pavlova_lutheri.AAC.5
MGGGSDPRTSLGRGGTPPHPSRGFDGGSIPLPPNIDISGSKPSIPLGSGIPPRSRREIDRPCSRWGRAREGGPDPKP